MIDFRYHLVSLMSVFLALAVGIALGAGPLKEAIGDTLTGQVDQLRAEKEELRAELSGRATELAAQEAAFSAVAPSLLEGVLGGRRVAIIQVSEVTDEVHDQVVARLGDAGATVTATVQVTDDWNDPGKLTFRETLGSTLVEYLDPVPPQDAGTGTDLAEALVQSLTSASPTDPDLVAETSGVILQLLTDGGLVTIDGAVAAPADAVVVLAGATVEAEAPGAGAPSASGTPADDTAERELREATIGAALQICLAAQARSTGAVVVGGELTEDSLIARVRGDDEAVDQLSTVESVHTLTGQVSVPLALSARIAGTVGQYGPSDGAEAVMPPRVVLPPVDRTPESVEPPLGPETGEAAPTEPTVAPTP